MIVTGGQTTDNVTILVSVFPPVAVMVNVAVHVPLEEVAKVIILPVDEKPDPEAT